MAGTTAQQQQANGKRAAIYARVSDKSQDGQSIAHSRRQGNAATPMAK